MKLESCKVYDVFNMTLSNLVDRTSWKRIFFIHSIGPFEDYAMDVDGAVV
jgi:hypothetical protein